MKRIIRWFSGNVKSKNCYGLFCCEEHGLIKGRFKVKQADNGLYYAIRILKMTDEAGAEKVKQRQIKERIHRKLRNEKKRD